jgi:hypothetical protein
MALATGGASIAGSASSSSSGPQKQSTSLLRGKDAAAKWKFAGRAVKMGVAFEAVRSELENESERTRLLKEVTKSAATQRAVRRFDSGEYLKKRRITLEPGEQDGFESPRGLMHSPRTTLKHHGRHKSIRSRDSKAPGHREPYEDTICAEISDGTNLSQLLTASCKNVDEMRAKLKADEGKFDRQRRRTADWSWPQNAEIQMAYAGLNVPKISEASRGEVSAVKFVQESVNFEELDSLEELIQNNDGYDGLRKVFDRRFEYHARMKLLNDFVLKDPEALRSALVGPIPENHPSERLASPSSPKLKITAQKSQSMSAAMFQSSMGGKRAGSMHPLLASPLNRSTQKRGKSYAL